METHRLVLPEDLNHFGFLFGGRLLAWVDEACWIAASLDYPNCLFVTIGMDKVVETATRMGVSAPSISSWENGRVRPKPARMEKLAAILGVDIAALLEDPAPEGPAPEGMQSVIDRGREQIARAIGISPDQVRITIEF